MELTQIGDDIAQGKHTMTGVDTEALLARPRGRSTRPRS